MIRSAGSAVPPVLVAAALLLLPAAAPGQNVRAAGVDSLHVRASLQPQLDGTTVDDEDASTEWKLRRARLGLRVWAAGWIRGDVEYDMARGRPRLTDAIVRLDFAPAVRILLGQFKKPFDALELVSSRELLVVERDGTPRGADGPTPNGLVNALGYSDRDIGVEWSGGSGPWRLTAGAFNGSGDNAEETNDGKQLAARLAIEIGDGWELAAAGTTNRVAIDRIEAGGVTHEEDEWASAGEVALVGGAYGEPGWKALAQAFVGENHAAGPVGPGEDPPGFLALQAIAGYHVAVFDVPFVIGVEPAARFGWTDPDTDLDDDEATLLTAGLNLYHHEQLKTQLGVDVLKPSEGDSETGLRLMTTLAF